MSIQPGSLPPERCASSRAAGRAPSGLRARRNDPDVPPFLERARQAVIVEPAPENPVEVDRLAAGHGGEGGVPLAHALVAAAGEDLVGEADILLPRGDPRPIFFDRAASDHRRIERRLAIARFLGEQGAGLRRIALFPGLPVALEPGGEARFVDRHQPPFRPRSSWAASSATCRPWKRAPSSSMALGWREPSLSASVLAP